MSGRGAVFTRILRSASSFAAELLQEVEVIGSIVYDDDDHRAVIQNMADGRYDTTGWVEHAPLSELHGVYDELRAGRKMKVLMDL